MSRRFFYRFFYRFFVGRLFDPIAAKLGYMHVGDVARTLDNVYTDFDATMTDDHWIADDAARSVIRTAINRINPNY